MPRFLPGTTVDLVFLIEDAPDTTPQGRVGKWDASGSPGVDDSILSWTGLTGEGGGNPVGEENHFWGLSFTLPDDIEHGQYYAIVSYAVLGADKFLIQGFEVEANPFHYDSQDCADVNEPTWLGTFMVSRLNQMQKILHRLMNPNLTRQTPVVEDIFVNRGPVVVNQGDTPLIELQVFRHEPPKSAQDITGATVVFRVRRTTNLSLILFERECEIVNPDEGTCQLQLQASDTAEEGLFLAEVEVTFADSSVLTTQRFDYRVDAP